MLKVKPPILSMYMFVSISFETGNRRRNSSRETEENRMKENEEQSFVT